jgi:hypothetical protein
MVATLIGGAIVTEATRTYFKTKEEAQAIADKCNEEKGDSTYIYEVWHASVAITSSGPGKDTVNQAD